MTTEFNKTDIAAIKIFDPKLREDLRAFHTEHRQARNFLALEAMQMTQEANAIDFVRRPLYIALDFDGVLHHCSIGPKPAQLSMLTNDVDNNAFLSDLEAKVPLTVESPNFITKEGRLFDRQHHLVELIEQLKDWNLFSEIRVVYSTSWRVVPTARLNMLLAPKIAAAVVGALSTQNHEIERDLNDQRSIQMEAWLAARNEEDALFIALDDQGRHWGKHPNALVQTHWRGLDEDTVLQALLVAQTLYTDELTKAVRAQNKARSLVCV